MMSRSADDPGPEPPTVDLDGLIGDIRRESARMRAAPQFPLDREVALGAELDRLAPGPARPRLDRLVDVLDALGRSRPLGAAGPSAGGILGRLKPAAADPNAGGELAGAVADALRVVSARLADIEGRLGTLEARDVRAAPGPLLAVPEADGGGPELSRWLDVATEVVPPSAGRVLYAGTDPTSGLAALLDAGFDAYGLGPGDPDGSGFSDDDDVRVGDLADHLASVGDRALAAVLIKGPTTATTGAGVDRLSAELGRVAAAVLVVSEAPWWWARRVGAAHADLAAARPWQPDTWMAVLDSAGFTVSALYDGTGSTYLVTATRPG